MKRENEKTGEQENVIGAIPSGATCGSLPYLVRETLGDKDQIKNVDGAIAVEC